MIYLCLGIAIVLGPTIDSLSHRAPQILQGTFGSVRGQHYFLHPNILRETRSKRVDYFIVPLLFASLFSRLVLAAVIGKRFDNLLVWAALSIVAAATMRGFQEISHYALHGSLVPDRSFGLALADICAQAMLIKPHIGQRVQTHVILHHPNVNDEAVDPNIQDYIRLGFQPPMSNLRFLHWIIYPLSPHGIYASMSERLQVIRTGNPLRLLAPLAMIYLISLCGGFASVFFVYLIPLLTLYPWFAWLSQLVEHRWFTGGKHSRAGEYSSGRTLILRGVPGILTKWLILPFGDAYHLAHSLYPTIRWNYLSSIHFILLRFDHEYAAAKNEGLIFARDHGLSVFTDLKRSLVLQSHGDNLEAIQ